MQYKFRCSQSNYLFTCPPSVLDDKLIRVSTDNREARMGKALHQVAGNVVKKTPVDYENICNQHGLSNDADVQELTELTNYLRLAWNKLGKYFPDPKVEYRLPDFVVNSTTDRCTISGTVDLFSKHESNKIIFLDWKSGRSQKGYESQMAAYAYGLWSESGFEQDIEITGVVVFLRHGCYYVTHYDRSTMDTWKNDLLCNILTAPKTFCPSDLCKFCDLYLNCPARESLSKSIIEVMFSGDDKNYLEKAKQVLKSIDKNNKDQRIVGELIDDLMFRARLASQLSEDTGLYIKQLLNSVGDIRLNDDYTLALHQRERYSLTGPEVLNVLRNHFSDDQISRCMSVSMSKLKDMHRRHNSGTEFEAITGELSAKAAMKKTEYQVAEVIKNPRTQPKKKEKANGTADKKSD